MSACFDIFHNGAYLILGVVKLFFGGDFEVEFLVVQVWVSRSGQCRLPVPGGFSRGLLLQ